MNFFNKKSMFILYKYLSFLWEFVIFAKKENANLKKDAFSSFNKTIDYEEFFEYIASRLGVIIHRIRGIQTRKGPVGAFCEYLEQVFEEVLKILEGVELISKNPILEDLVLNLGLMITKNQVDNNIQDEIATLNLRQGLILSSLLRLDSATELRIDSIPSCFNSFLQKINLAEKQKNTEGGIKPDLGSTFYIKDKFAGGVSGLFYVEVGLSLDRITGKGVYQVELVNKSSAYIENLKLSLKGKNLNLLCSENFEVKNLNSKARARIMIFFELISNLVPDLRFTIEVGEIGESKGNNDFFSLENDFGNDLSSRGDLWEIKSPQIYLFQSLYCLDYQKINSFSRKCLNQILLIQNVYKAFQEGASLKSVYLFIEKILGDVGSLVLLKKIGEVCIEGKDRILAGLGAIDSKSKDSGKEYNKKLSFLFQNWEGKFLCLEVANLSKGEFLFVRFSKNRSLSQMMLNYLGIFLRMGKRLRLLKKYLGLI